jgi:hypothetical protein
VVNAKAILVGIVVVLFGAAFVGFGAMTIVPQVQQTSTADPVDAVVTSSEVVTTTGDRGGATRSIPAVTYRYTYEGTEYTSDSVFPGRQRSTASTSAEDIVDNHPEGADVTAMVAPGDPGTAYLVDPGFSVLHLVMPVVGVLAALIGVGKILQGLRGGSGPITIGV